MGQKLARISELLVLADKDVSTIKTDICTLGIIHFQRQAFILRDVTIKYPTTVNRNYYDRYTLRANTYALIFFNTFAMPELFCIKEN